MRPLLPALFLLVLFAPAPAGAQFVARPQLDWRTVETEHFTVHYPAGYREWTQATIARLESARTAVGQVVGFTPAARVQVLVDDPANAPNGFALPFVAQPTMVFFPVPPTPRQAIGNSRDWGELLAVHEFAHLAHLARPARGRFDPYRLLPVHVGPIMRGVPRWVTEGFATFVEGRVTGSGRPNNAQRAALLRQWAVEGRLPTYAQISGSEAYNGRAFAYLVGSAYLDWLAARDGDSTITHVWRRMTAATKRSFVPAFAGVYGRHPADLYGRFAAEVTRSALTVEERIAALGGPVDGELVQRLSWETGDPALSPDGSRVAVILRQATKPGDVVIWRTAPDTIATTTARARAAAARRARARDSLDVPDRTFFPPAKRVVARLRPRDGRGFDTPRFMPDGQRLLVTRAEPIGSGAFRPDLHMWNSTTGATRRITRGAGVRQPDPEPGSTSAVAVQCTRGWCDLVRVMLADGSVRVLRAGSPTVSYYRPRVSPDGAWIAVAEQRDDQWRIVLVDARDPARIHEVRPGDRMTRFDVSWADSGRTLLAVSEAGGIANVERIDVESGRTEPLTRVIGGAFAPAAAPRGGDAWFLALHSRGLDVRRLPGNAPAVTLPPADPALFPAMPAKPPTMPALATQRDVAERPYGTGPRSTRWLPGVARDAAATSGQLLLLNGDPVGRLEVAVLGAFGSESAWRGARTWMTVRRWRPAFTADAFYASQRPGDDGGAGAAALDVDLAGVGLRTTGRFDRSAWSASGATGIAGMRASGAGAHHDGAARGVAWAVADVSARKRLFGVDLAGVAVVRGDAGRHGGDRVAHLATSGALVIDAPVVPAVQLSATRARDAAGGGPAFERIAVGGAAPVLLDRDLLPQRLAMPALPAGSLVGTAATVVRADVMLGVLMPYAWSARVDGSGSDAWHRVAGVEARFGSSAFPIVTIPRVELVGGAGYSLDAPFRRRTTLYASVAYRP